MSAIHTDLLIDGPYIPARAEGAGELRSQWRGGTGTAGRHLLFAVGVFVGRTDVLVATEWTPPRLQAAIDALVAAPPRGLKVQLDGIGWSC
jgi:hypothetical protein